MSSNEDELGEPLLEQRPPAPRFPDTREGRNKLKNLLFGAYFPEYAMLPLFRYAGRHEYFKTATAVQAGFLVGSSYFQYIVAMDYKNKNSYVDEPGEALSGKVETIMGLPVKFLKMDRWTFEFVSQMPNYVQNAGKCMNDADQAVWSKTGKDHFMMDLYTCFENCCGDFSCAKDCTLQRRAYTDDCATCFGDFSVCTMKFCQHKCIGGVASECVVCFVAGWSQGSCSLV